jgi:Uma2 family endonuclease
MAKITQLSQLDLSAQYSYADYLTWQLSAAIELIKGKISMMAAVPNVKHQRLYDRRKSILAGRQITTVMQPDICVICDDKLGQQDCNGAPDWVIEIISKSTSQKDAQIKYRLYAAESALFPEFTLSLTELFEDH